jgi:PST family polysaccharide transporter
MTAAAVVAVAAGAGILLLAPWLARLAFGQAALAVVPVIRAAAFFPLAAALSGMIGMLGLIPQGMDRAQSRMLIAAGVLNVAVASVWIHHAGAVGGVLSMLLIETLLCVGGLMLLAREQNGETRA